MREYLSGQKLPTCQTNNGQTSDGQTNDGQTNNGQTSDESQIFSASYKPDAVFKAALRHSKRVRLLKFFLPVVAIIIAAIFSWFTFFLSQSKGNLVIVNDDATQNGYLTMKKPRLEGYTAALKPYFVTAQKAIQNPLCSGIINLENIQAQLPSGENGIASIEAENGTYDNINGRLKLTKPFTVTISDGTSAKLHSADIDLGQGQLMTKQPVTMHRSGQTLEANAMRIDKNGQVLLFYKGVKLTIHNVPDNAGEQDQNHAKKHGE